MYVSGIKFLIHALDKRSKKTNLIKQDFIDLFVSGGDSGQLYLCTSYNNSFHKIVNNK